MDVTALSVAISCSRGRRRESSLVTIPEVMIITEVTPTPPGEDTSADQQPHPRPLGGGGYTAELHSAGRTAEKGGKAENEGKKGGKK